jgi:hypothetical protein
MSEWYIIDNLSEFTDKARAIVFNNFGQWNDTSEVDDLIGTVHATDQKELDQLLTHQESLIIVKQFSKKQTHKKNNKVRYLLNSNLFYDIIFNLNARMTSNIINNLVQKGLVETAFDNEANDFIFWVKNNDDKPETD